MESSLIYDISPDVTALTTFRDAVVQNLEDALFLSQVHSNNIVVIDHADDARLISGQKADGYITNCINISLGIRTADCLPVFLFEPNVRCISLVHAGWKGTQQSIVAKAVEKMRQCFKANPSDIVVQLGPAIGQCCYQVSEEFKKYFPNYLISRNEMFYFDLIAANKDQLSKAGISEKNINDCNICTCCDHRCFSYRREGKKAGRMVSIMSLNE